jgi:hypothetical protein
MHFKTTEQVIRRPDHEGNNISEAYFGGPVISLLIFRLIGGPASSMSRQFETKNVTDICLISPFCYVSTL